MRFQLAALLVCGIFVAFLDAKSAKFVPFASQEFRSVSFESDSNEEATSAASAAVDSRVASTEESQVAEDGSDDDDDDFVAQTTSAAADENEWAPCPKEMFMRSAGKCHPCSMCGPDLYVRRACGARRDTTCDWCLNPTPVENADFRAQCADVIQLQREFNTLLEKRHSGKPSLIKSLGSSSSSSSSSKDDSSNDEFVAESRIRISVVSPVYGGMEEEAAANSYRFARLRSLISASYKAELLLEACLYLALVALLFVVVRFIAKSRPQYRTITVNPPVLDDTDKKNIIRAADEIREKIGKKGYNRLEEFI